MKPDGRSLDIVAVGLGQAGGNLAAELFRRGYSALALNTAETDLVALDPGGAFPSVPPERRLYVGLDGYDGAGADPAYGRDCIRAHADRIRQAVLKQAHEADAVVITAGLGGGTGSAIRELVEILEPDELPLVALMTLPSESESGLAKVNAVRAINEIVDAPLLGWVFIDNARIAALNRDVAVADYYAHINAQIIAPIDELNRLNDRKLHPLRSFDGEDFRKLLLSGGVLNYAVSELPALSTSEVVGTLKDCLDASDLMPSGFDVERLSYLGLVVEAPESALAGVPIQVFEEIHEAIKRATGGAAVYQGIYQTGDDTPVVLRLIVATQSMPHRIREILADAKREGAVLGNKIREELPSLELGEIENIELFRTPGRRNSERPKRRPDPRTRSAETVEDVPPEVGGGRRRRRPATEGAAPAGRPRARARTTPAEDRTPAPSTSEPSPREIGTEEIDLQSALAELREVSEAEADPVTDAHHGLDATESQPAVRPDDYEQLVATYLGAQSSEERRNVVKRLETDGRSSDAAVRYYAVQAMAKLGPKVFATALAVALEDEDQAVADLAAEALRA